MAEINEVSVHGTLPFPEEAEDAIIESGVRPPSRYARRADPLARTGREPGPRVGIAATSGHLERTGPAPLGGGVGGIGRFDVRHVAAPSQAGVGRRAVVMDPPSAVRGSGDVAAGAVCVWNGV